MISGHIKAISALGMAIAELRDTAAQLPDSTLKGNIQARAEGLEETLQAYADQSCELYDAIVDFGFRCAS